MFIPEGGDKEKLLKSLLEQALNVEKETIDFKKLRYVMYTRKSTTDETRQECSIPDQVADCTQLVNSEGLNLVEIIRESESARESGIRPKFEQMIVDLKAGKYDGIIAWHPDRLARNMKDAGTLIDLLDKQIIKDLRFKTSTFENSPMGKMLLGISFVLSKQYTDHLSESVKRGIDHRLTEGKWVGKPKHGYYIDPNKRLRPDGENWNLIKRAFQMRLDNEALTDIADYLNKQRYSKASTPYTEPASRSTFKMTVQTLSAIFKDPFYAGVAIYGDNVIQLDDLYDFTAVVTEDEWKKLCPMETAAPNSQVSRLYRSSKYQVEADLLRRIVICGYCSRPMSSGITTKKRIDGSKEYRYYYRCETRDCSFKNKSVRGKVVMDFIYSFFESFVFATEEAYANYQKELNEESKEQVVQAKDELKSFQKDLEKTKTQYQQIKALCSKDPEVTPHFKTELELYRRNIPLLENQILEQKKVIAQAAEVPIAYENFLELAKNLASTIKEAEDISLKDKYIREVFSNLIVRDKQIVDYSLKEPFASWVKEGKFLNGRGSRT